jgi:hypothetical protein
LWRHKDTFAELDIEVVLVSFEPLERIRWYLADAPFAWPVLLDPDRHLYKAYGFERTSFRRAWLSRRTLAHYLRAALKGRLPHRPVADTLQLGGDVLIDPTGTVRFVHQSREPADRPSVQILLDMARQWRSAPTTLA